MNEFLKEWSLEKKTAEKRLGEVIISLLLGVFKKKTKVEIS